MRTYFELVLYLGIIFFLVINTNHNHRSHTKLNAVGSHCNKKECGLIVVADKHTYDVKLLFMGRREGGDSFRFTCVLEKQ